MRANFDKVRAYRRDSSRQIRLSRSAPSPARSGQHTAWRGRRSIRKLGQCEQAADVEELADLYRCRRWHSLAAGFSNHSEHGS